MNPICPICNKPHCVTGSGPITKLKIPFGGMCQCGGVAGLIAERDRLRGEVERLKAASIRAECMDCGVTMLHECSIRSDEMQCWQCGSRDMTLRPA